MPDAKGFQRHFESVFRALLLALKGAFAILEFFEQEFPEKPMVWHIKYMALSRKLALYQDGMDNGKVTSGEHLCVWDLVLPFYAK